jgi:hypothetical protein
MRVTEHLWLLDEVEKYCIGDVWYKSTHAKILEGKVVYADFYRCIYYYIRRMYTLTGTYNLQTIYNFVASRVGHVHTLSDVESHLHVPISQILKLKKVSWAQTIK